MIRDIVLSYVDHLMDFAYLGDALSQCDTPQLVDGIVGLLHDPDRNVVGQACLFICDLILIAPKRGLWLAFRDAYSTSPIVPTLEELVLAKNHFIRDHAIYTLGKTCSTASVPALYRAFQSLRDRDPLILPNLIFELKWLGFEAQELWSLVDGMTTSSRFTTRWAALAVLEKHASGADPDLSGAIEQCFERLCHDDHPLVRAEAEYRHQEWLVRQRSSTLVKAESRKRRRDLKRYKPAFLFWDIEMRYSHYLSLHRLIDYSIADLEQFIEQMIRVETDHPSA